MDARLGRAARRVRQEHGIDLLPIAEAAGVSQATLSRFERGGGWPRRTHEIVQAYALVCGVEPGEPVARGT